MAGEAEDPGIDQNEMIALVRRILDGADLSQTTGKIVRQKVLDELGARAGSDMRALKRSIRDALNVVLKNQVGSSATPAPVPGPNPKLRQDDQATGQEQEEVQDNEANGSARPEIAVDAPVGSDGPPLESVDASGHDADVEGEKGSVQPRESKSPVIGKKRRSRTVVDEDDADADDDFNPDNDETNPSPMRITKASKLTPSPSRPRMSSEITASPSRPKKTSPRRGPARPVKRSRSDLFTTEKHLEKLRGVCKQLGCAAPPSRMRGKTLSEKCAAVVEHLLQKGVDVPNPTLLTRKEIAVHRARLEQEKELAGLDTSNIIEDGRRARRSRVPVKPNPEKSGELPSDFSGEELSGSSAHEADSDEYEVSSVDSE